MDSTPVTKSNELNPQQQLFLAYYLDPRLDTFGNALQSALKANYSQEYAENITHHMPDWLAENVGKHKGMLLKAEKRLSKSIDSEDERVALDASKFVSARLGKDEGWAERQEHTGKDGKDLPPSVGVITNDDFQRIISGFANRKPEETGTPESI